MESCRLFVVLMLTLSAKLGQPVQKTDINFALGNSLRRDGGSGGGRGGQRPPSLLATCGAGNVAETATCTASARQIMVQDAPQGAPHCYGIFLSWRAEPVRRRSPAASRVPRRTRLVFTATDCKGWQGLQTVLSTILFPRRTRDFQRYTYKEDFFCDR